MQGVDQCVRVHTSEVADRGLILVGLKNFRIER